MLAQFWMDTGISAEYTLCSSAIRTRQTLAVLQDLCSLGNSTFSDDLYLADHTCIHKKISMMDDSISSILVVGHNNGLSDLVSRLVERSVVLATCEYAQLTFEATNWSEIFWGTGQQKLGFSPRVVKLDP
jgi:phosphohistidine phosphatase